MRVHVAFMCWVLMLAQAGWAQQAPSLIKISVELDKIRAQVSTTQGEIALLQRQFAELVKESKQHDATLAKLKDEQRRIEQKLRTLLEERKGLETAVNNAEARLALQRERVVDRLRALYMSSDTKLPSGLLWRVSTPERERSAVYIRAVRRADQDKIVGFSKALDDLGERRRALNASVAIEETLVTESRSRQESVAGELSNLKKIADQISVKKKGAERALKKLKGDAQRLDQVIAAITSGMVEVPPDGGSVINGSVISGSVINGSVINGTAINANVTNRQPQQATPSAALPVVANIDPGTDVQKVAAVIPIPLPLPPGGLFAKGIRLSAPVKGKVLQHFGKVKVTDFSDMIFSKGLEYAVAAGSSVYSVYPGKVAYVGMMPGYETVVVLEHGERSYSLYGRLGKSVVKIGDAISKDQAVGIVSDVDQKGRNFYFEVRKSGTPVDPKTVLTKTTR